VIDFTLPLVGFAAYSGTGKTTLLCKLIPLLAAKGYRIGIIKHTHHNIEIDKPGKDSFELRESGASQIVVASRNRTAIIIEEPKKTKEPELSDALLNLNTESLDFNIDASSFSDLDYNFQEISNISKKINLNGPKIGIRFCVFFRIKIAI